MSLDRLERAALKAVPKGLKFDLDELGPSLPRLLSGGDGSDVDLPKVVMVTEQQPPITDPPAKEAEKEASAQLPGGKLWYKVQYKETVRQENGVNVTERTYAQTPFGKDVKVQLKDGKIVAVTDKDGKRIPGLEVTPEGEIFYVQGGRRVKLNEHLVPTEVQKRNGNVWETEAKVGDKGVVSIQIDESKNIIWKLQDGNGFAILHSGNARIHFRDEESGGRIIRTFDNGDAVIIEVRNGKEVVTSKKPKGSTTNVGLKEGEEIDPLTGGTVTIEAVKLPAVGGGPAAIREVKCKVTTLPGGVVVRQELEPDGVTVKKDGTTEIIEPGPNGSTRTRRITTNDNGSSTTEVIVRDQGNETRFICERDSEGRIKSLTYRQQVAGGAVKEQTLSFEYENGLLKKIRVHDGDGTKDRIFVRTGERTWNGFLGEESESNPLYGPDNKPMKDYDLNPQLNQETGGFTMNLKGFETAGQQGDPPVMPRGDAPVGPSGDGGKPVERDYITQQRCMPILLGFDPKTGLPIWAFSGHPLYTPGFAGTTWQFTTEKFEHRAVVGDQGKTMFVSRRDDPANPGKYIQETEFPASDYPSGAVWRNRDGSMVTGVRKVVTQWDKEKGCYVTTLYRQPGEPVYLYVTEEGLRYDPVKKEKIDDGLDTPRVRAAGADTRSFNVKQDELRGRIGPLVAEYDTTPSSDTAKKEKARDGAKEAIADYRRLLQQEIQRIHDEVYGQNNGQPFNATQKGAEFQAKAGGLLAEVQRLNDLEARLK